MHFGLIMECDYRYGNTLQESFDEAFGVVDAAESGGLDGVWLAERHFATTKETFPRTGTQGYHIFVGLRGLDRPDLVQNLKEYQRAWKEAGHEGEGDVFLRIPVYVAETAEKARSEPEESTWRSYRRLAETFGRSASDRGATADEERTERYQRLSEITYDDLLRDRLAYGTPDAVAKQLKEIAGELQLSGIIAETNVGGVIPPERVKNSIRLFTEEVVPQLR